MKKDKWVPETPEMPDASDMPAVGIPMFTIVKYRILQIRSACEDQIGRIVMRQAARQNYSKERERLQAYVAVLYQELKLKFHGDKADVSKLDDVIRKGRQLTFPELYDYFQIFNRKIEELKITKFETPDIDPDATM